MAKTFRLGLGEFSTNVDYRRRVYRTGKDAIAQLQVCPSCKGRTRRPGLSVQLLPADRQSARPEGDDLQKTASHRDILEEMDELILVAQCAMEQHSGCQAE